MYTEISHFLLLHAISLANLWIFRQSLISKEMLFPFFYLDNFSLNKPRVFYTEGRNNNQKNTKKGFGRTYAKYANRNPMLAHKQAILNYKSNSRVRGAIQGNTRRLGANDHQLLVASIFSIFFLTLTSCLFGTISNYVCSDFSIYNILTNSTADIPLFYKISATWSNHEGSLLLWCWLLSASTFLFCISIRNSQFASLHSGVQFLFSGIFYKFVVSNLCLQMYKHIERPYTLWTSSTVLKLPSINSSVQNVARNNVIAGSIEEFSRQQNGNPFRQLKKNASWHTSVKLQYFVKNWFHRKQINFSFARKIITSRMKNKLIREIYKNQQQEKHTLLTTVRESGFPVPPPSHRVLTFARRAVSRNRLNRRLGSCFSIRSLGTPRLTSNGGAETAQVFSIRKEGKYPPFALSRVPCFHSTKRFDLAQEDHENLGKKTGLPASLILIFFTTFCVATSNPFLRTSIPCISSLAELNPILQDPVLAIHPPCIYAGYVASAIVFCLCMSSFYKNSRVESRAALP